MRFTFQRVFIVITYIHIVPLTLYKYFIITHINVYLPYVNVKLALNRYYILTYYIFDPIWETVPHSPIPHITKSRNILLTICILLAGAIHMNPGPPILQNICLATSNVMSLHNKSASITGLVIFTKLDILALPGKWLSRHDTTSSISDICPPPPPPDYSCYHHPRQSRRGGRVGSLVSNNV